MCGLWIWPEPNSQYFVCGVWIALCSVQSASGIIHSGKRLFFSPLHTEVVCIHSGEGILWMSWVTKASSKAVPAHWNQLCHWGLKLGEGESEKQIRESWLEPGPEKMCVWHSLLHKLSCKLSRTSYPLHSCQYKFANSNFPESWAQGFFPLHIFSLQRRHWTRSKASAAASIWSCL